MNVKEKYCKYLMESFGGSIVKVTKPPTYISNLRPIIDQQDPIILIFEQAKPKENTYLNYAGPKGESDTIDSIADLSVTGQPLECPFENSDDSLNITVAINPAPVSEDYYHAPLSQIEARRCLSFVNLKTTPPLPVWILTDMSDRNKIFLLGSERESNWRTRHWAIVHSNQTEKLPIKELLENFENLFKINTGYKITSEVTSTFNIKDQPGMAKNSKCFLEANWKTPSYEVPFSQADTNLIIECNVGQEESQISRWWEQLILLHNYLEIIKQQKETQQKQFTYQRDSIKLPSFKNDHSTVSSLQSRVLELLQSSDSMSVCRQLASQHNVTSALNSTIHELLADKQKGQDFTDRLWSLLIEAETYQELAECFQLVFREVRKRSVNPYIFSKNKTRLASLLRGLPTSSSDIELMLEPLELMVEMGLEKLKRDYMFMFLASQIASEESLAFPKLPSFSEGGGGWQTTVDAWLRWLAQLHTVLELVSVIHMTMSTEIVVQVTGLALATYVSPQSPVLSLQHLINNRTYDLQAPVLTKEVKTFIDEDRTFYKWMLKLSAEAKNQKLSSTYVFLEESPLPERLLVLLEEDSTINKTDILMETVHEGSMLLSKLHEKYTYIQMCSISENLP